MILATLAYRAPLRAQTIRYATSAAISTRRGRTRPSTLASNASARVAPFATPTASHQQNPTVSASVPQKSCLVDTNQSSSTPECESETTESTNTTSKHVSTKQQSRNSRQTTTERPVAVVDFVREMQARYPGDILFVQLGSFYTVWDIDNNYFDRVAAILGLKIFSDTDRKRGRLVGFPIRLLNDRRGSSVTDALSESPTDQQPSTESTPLTSTDHSAFLPRTLNSESGPATTLNVYLARLFAAMDTRVVIIDQEADPTNPKLIRRRVSRVVSPGTMLDSQLLSAESRFLATMTALHNEEPNSKNQIDEVRRIFALSWIDISVGVLTTTVGDIDHVRRQLSVIHPVELLFDTILFDGRMTQEEVGKGFTEDERSAIKMFSKQYYSRRISLSSKFAELVQSNRLDDKVVKDISEESSNDNDSTKISMSPSDTPMEPVETRCAVLVLQYLDEIFPNKQTLKVHLRTNSATVQNRIMLLDETAQQALEIVRPLTSRSSRNCLMGILNKTATASGSRLLSSRLLEPSTDLALIKKRHALLQLLIENDSILKFMMRDMKCIGDLERMLQRIEYSIPDFDDYSSIRQSVSDAQSLFAGILERLQSVGLVGLPTIALPRILKVTEECIEQLPDIFETNTETGERIMTTGLCPDFDDAVHYYNALSRSMDDIKRLLMEPAPGDTERPTWEIILGTDTRTQRPICTMRSGSEKAFKFLERKKESLPKGELNIVSRTKSSVKFTMRQWTDHHSNMLDASGQLEFARKQYLNILREKVSNVGEEIRLIARNVAALDVASSLAQVAIAYGYTKPEMVEESVHDVIGGRHPVVENAQLLRGSPYHATDYSINEDERLLLVTGPNMGGKSTLLRQSALISVMAQAGSFVAAYHARLGVVDRVLARIGASDDLASHRSTFMVEMTETARILRMATPKSFVIIDELGRGTSTRDGVSIAYAVLQYLHDTAKCRGIFATHYMELAKIVDLGKRLDYTNTNKAAIMDSNIFAESIVKDCNALKSENIWTPFKHAACYKTEVFHLEDEDKSKDSESSGHDIGQILCTYKLVPGVMESSYGVHVARKAGLPPSVIEVAAKTATTLFGPTS